MTNKQKLLAAVKKLPANTSYEDALGRLIFLAKIEKASKMRMRAGQFPTPS